MSSEEFSVPCDSFQTTFRTSMRSLLENEDFVDVTLAVEGRYLKAHKVMLSMYSPYFLKLFKTSPCKHPIVFMKDVSYDAVSDLIKYMYQGEVEVSEEQFPIFIKTAESLQIKGLRDISNYCNDSTELSQQNNSIEQEIPRFDYPVKFFHTYAKRPRLSESPLQPVTREETAITNEVELKIDQNNSIIADDTNEDFSMMEEADELQTDTSGNDVLKKAESISKNIEETATPGVRPENTKGRYEYAFKRFEKWCDKHDIQIIDEEVLMRYFEEKSVTCKSSSLWAERTMLKKMILIKENQDIGSYKKLGAFLRKQSEEHQVIKLEVCKREHFEKFLKNADNNKYLLMKVAMIIADAAGGCSIEDLLTLNVKNVEDEGNLMRFLLLDSQTNSLRDFTVTAGNIEGVNMLDIIRNYMKLRPAGINHGRFFICYQNGKCIKQVVEVNTFRAMPKNIAHFLGLEIPEQFRAHCFRRNSKELKECFFSLLGTKMNE